MLGHFAMQAFPPVAASGGYSPVAAQELLMEAASCIAVHWLQSIRASAAAVPRLQSSFSSCGSRAERLTARGIFPHEGSNPCFLHQQVDSLPLSHQGSPSDVFIKEVSKHVLICLKEISPGCSLEGLMLKLKLQYFGHWV